MSRTLPRQDSLTWGDAWSTPSSLSSPPPQAPPNHSAFAPDPSPALATSLPGLPGLDYSVLDLATPNDYLSSTEHNGESGFGGNLLPSGAGAQDWHLQTQHRVSVTMKPHLEGFILKHNVWLVSGDSGLTVERRYSDFVWLLESLLRRYPFRLLPSLPPKRLQVSGHYLATDDLFLERRRRGLERALTVLTHHPVVKLDGLLSVFLNEQADLTLWRKHNPITLSEESLTRPLSTSALSSLPTDLDARLHSLRSRLPSLVDHWTTLSKSFDRLAHRRLNQGFEFQKLREKMGEALGVEGGGWRPKEVEGVEREMEAVRKVAGQVGEEMEREAKRKVDTAVEDVKRHRELYINLRDLFTRQTLLGVDNVPKLQKRVETNLAKLSLLQSSTQQPRPPSFASDLEKYTQQIEEDKREIERQMKRREWVRWCVWEEVVWGFRQTSLLSTALRDLASSEAAYARRLAEQWGALGDALGAEQ